MDLKPSNLVHAIFEFCESLNSKMDPDELWTRGLSAATTCLSVKVSPLPPLMKFPSAVCAPFHLHKGSSGHF